MSISHTVWNLYWNLSPLLAMYSLISSGVWPVTQLALMVSHGTSWVEFFFREWDELLINSTRPNGWAVGWVELGFFVLVNCRLAAARSKSRNKKIKIKIKEKWVSRRDEPICIFSSKPAHVLSSQSKHGLTLNT